MKIKKQRYIGWHPIWGNEVASVYENTYEDNTVAYAVSVTSIDDNGHLFDMSNGSTIDYIPMPTRYHTQITEEERVLLDRKKR